MTSAAARGRTIGEAPEFHLVAGDPESRYAVVNTSRWSSSDVPDQSSKTIIVTGANSGLGEQTARVLAEHGATVILACRNVRKGEAAAGRMSGQVSVRQLDLADLSSVHRFADTIDSADVLINNAGIMAVPKGRTADGFESQFGTNFLGPFALTGLLLPRISDRVVTLSSLAHLFGSVDLDDLNWQNRHYERWQAYGQSKLADLMFAYELQRRLTATGSSVRSVAAHPGFARTELHTGGGSLQSLAITIGSSFSGQNAAMGALPTLYAATAADVTGGDYYGPGGLGEMRGHPKRVGSSRRSRDSVRAAALWTRASALTGVEFLTTAPPPAQPARSSNPNRL